MSLQIQTAASFILVLFFASSSWGSTPHYQKQSEILQFTSKGHVLGFLSDDVYVANGSHVLKIGFVGSKGAQPIAETSRKDDRTAQPLQKVTYSHLWPGINLSYTSTFNGIAESTWSIEPDADPEQIQLRYNAPVTIDADGSLKIQYAAGWMQESSPVAWQLINGRQLPVQVAFKKTSADGRATDIGFSLGSYDSAYPLFIDPVMQWNTFQGAYLWDVAYGISVDDAGNVYVAGRSSQTWGSPLQAHSGYNNIDGFVAKLDGAGNRIWNTFMGSSAGTEIIYKLTIDGSGNVYVCGYSQTSWGTGASSYSGGYDAFVAKLDSSGVRQWNTFLGSADNDYGYGIILGTTGDLFVVGRSDATWGTPLNSYTGAGGANAYEAFIARLDGNGSLLWNTFLGSTGSDVIMSITNDSTGNLLVAGYSDTAWGTPLNAYAGGWDAFAAKLSSAGTLLWNTFMGSSVNDYGSGIAVDHLDNVIIGGYSEASWGTPPTGGAYIGGTDVFVAKLASDGARLWNSFMGSAGADSGGKVAVDSLGNITVSGTSDATWGATPLNPYAGNGDAFAAQLDIDGNRLWNTFMGSSGSSAYHDYGYDLAVDCAGNAYVAGMSDYYSWGAPIAPFVNGTSNAFVARIGESGHVVCTSAPADQGNFSPSFQLASDSTTTSFDVNNEPGYTVDTVIGCGGTWSGGNPYTTAAVTTNCLVKATFAMTNGVTVNASVDTNGTLDAASTIVSAGSGASFTITPNAGYTTDATVSGDCPAGSWSAATYTTGPVSSVCSVSFTHTINNYTVTPFYGVNGTVTPDTPQSVDHGLPLQFTVTPDVNYTASVGGTCSGTLVGDTYTIDAVTTDCSVDVTFSLITYSVAASVDANGTLDTQLQTIDQGAAASFTVTPNTGFVTDASVGGTCPAGSWSGSTYTTGAIAADCSVSFTHTAVVTFTLTPSPGSPVRLISAGEYHSLALNGDGTVTAWGDNGNGQTTIPAGLSTATAVAAGGFHSMALQTDGTVVAWGMNTSGQATVPAGLTGVVAIAAGYNHSLALKNDGTVAAWGANTSGQTTVPPGLTDVVAIACGDNHSIALKGDGTLVAWGHDFFGQSTIPAGVTDIIAIAGGYGHTMALQRGGTLVVWGDDTSGQATVPSELTNVMAIAAGPEHSLAVQEDGTVVAWGANTGGQTNIPAGLSGVVTAAGGQYHSLALQNDGTVVAWGDVSYGQTAVPALLNLLPFDGADGTILPNVLQTVTQGSIAQFTLIPKTRYVASVGGTCGGTLVGNTFTTNSITADCTVEALFSPGGHIVTASVDANGALDTTSATVNDGAAASFTLTPDSGYTTDTAVGGDCPTGSWSGSTYTTGPVTGDCSVSFSHTINTYSVTAGVDANGVLDASSATADHGSSASFTVTADPGYATDTAVGGTCAAGSWSGSTYTTGAVTAQCTVTFTHSTLSYTVNAGVDDNGTLDTNSSTVDHGATASFTVTPNTGYITDASVGGTCSAGSWTGSTYTTDAITGPCSVTFTTSVIGFAVNASVDANGTLDNTAANVSYGSAASFTVTPAAGYVTDSAVGGDCPAGTWNASTYTTGPVTVSCSVSFTHTALSFAVNASVDAYGTLDSSTATVDYGTSASFTVTPATGYSTDTVVGGDCPAGSWNSLTYTTGTITAACSVNFTHTINSYTVTPSPSSPSISAGSQHSVALKNDGTVVAWGWDAAGQSTVPAGLTDVVALAAGGSYSLALKSDGTVVFWGYSEYDYGVSATLTEVVQISTKGAHFLALKGDGSVVAWGSNWAGQLDVPAGLTDAVAVSAGESHSLALKRDGTVVAWGWDDYGQATVPAALADVTAISAGKNHSLALKSDGTVVAWGFNSLGQSTVPATLANVIAVSAGYDHSLALKSDGTVTAWGTNSFFTSTVPTGLQNVVAISAGGYHSLALRDDGTVIAWGYDNYGQSTVPPALNLLPLPSAHGMISPNTIQTVIHGSSLQYHVQADVGYLAEMQGSCGGTLVDATYSTNSITADCTVAAVFTRGNIVNAAVDVNGTLDLILSTVADGSTASFVVTPSVGYTSDSAVTGDCPVGSWSGSTYTTGVISGDCTVAFSHTSNTYQVNAVIDANGSLDTTSSTVDHGAAASFTVTAASGYNPDALVGGDCPAGSWNGLTYSTGPVTNSCSVSFSNSLSYTATVSPKSPARLLAVGGPYSIVLKGDGTVVNWPEDGWGHQTVPQGLTNVAAVSVSTGGHLLFALHDNGTVTAWDYFGEETIPVSLTDIVAVDGGLYNFIALRSDGRVVMWGNNMYGNLNIPAGLHDVTAIAGGGYHSLALKSDWTVVGWGWDRTAPVPPGLMNVIAIAAGHSHSLALLSDGTVTEWGYDARILTTPAGLTNVVAITAGYNHSLALKNDGTVVAWGDNNYGQTDVPIGLDNVVAIAGGSNHSLALKSDGTVVKWGDELNGQGPVPTPLNLLPFDLRNGTITNHSPSMVSQGSNIEYTVTPYPGYAVSVDGTCGGVLIANTYLTSAITADCTVAVNFTPEDADLDGMDDVWEIAQFGDILTANATSDFDHDGYTDLQEYLNIQANELDPANNPYDPLIQNAAFGPGYVKPGNILWLTLPAILHGATL